MIDLHTHILPEMDDGAKTLDESISLLKLEIKNGVNCVALTPHFNFEHDAVDSFVKKRFDSHYKLTQELLNHDLEIQLIDAAEVFFSPELLQADHLDKLCYQGTKYMLIEFPYEYFPGWMMQTLYELRLRGITPVVAHVERYMPIEKKADLLYQLVSEGALIQVNAASLLNGKSLRNRIFEYISHNMVHFIVSDTHSVKHRPPVVKEALRVVERKFGKSAVDIFKNNAVQLSSNGLIEPDDPVKIKSRFWSLF